jgi:hypothetical protein
VEKIPGNYRLVARDRLSQPAPRRPSRAGAHAGDFGGAAPASLGALAARVSGRGADSLYRDGDVGDSRIVHEARIDAYRICEIAPVRRLTSVYVGDGGPY